MEFNTALLHKGFNGEKVFGSTLTPIYQVSAFSHSSAEQLEKVFNNRAPGYAYSRIGNPTVTSFENRITSIENGVGAVACSSGMAAVTMALLNILESGDEVIASAGLFGGTIDLFGDLEPFGIVTRYVNKVTAEEIEPLINEKTKAVFAELIGNPGLEIADLDAVSELVHSHGVPLIIDSTTATPYLIQPFEHGADIVVHSSSKYINGGGNSISGIIVDSGNFEWNTERYKGLAEYKKFGRLAYVAKLRNGIWRNIGCCLAPFNAFMNSVGLETLGLRMERLCYNALELAKFFETQNGIGAILTIRAGSKERAFKLINNLKYATNATNIGDTRTLVIHPSSTIYAHGTEEQKRNAGVFDDTIRISVGIEDIEDLKSDFKQAVDSINVNESEE